MPVGRREAMAGGAAWVLAGSAPAPVGRVVSLNPCLDAMLLAVADPGQIAALSHYSRDLQSSSAGPAAARFPFAYESAEAVMAFAPDLVLASRQGSLPTRTALQRLGVPLLLFATPDTMEESLQQMLRIAAAVGRRARGEAGVAAIQLAIAQSAPPPGGRRIRARLFQRDGFTTGPHTLMDELMTATGFENAAVAYGLTRSGNLPLERLLADPPEVLLQGERTPGAPGWGERVMRHPALARVAGRMRVVSFPERLMYCGGPNLARSAPLLAKAWRLAAGA